MTKLSLQEKFNFDIWMNHYDSVRTDLEAPSLETVMVDSCRAAGAMLRRLAMIQIFEKRKENMPISSFKRRGVYFILGPSGAAFIRGRRLF